MPRLIDADELLKHAYDSGAWKDAETGFHQRVVDIEDIEDAPIVDTVKHGHWEIIQKYYMECSVCKTRIDKRDLEWAMDVDADYCPHCGAKMDEEVKNEDQT